MAEMKTMDVSTFRHHIDQNTAPDSGWPPEIQALWWDAKGDWDKAHDCTQQDGGGSRCDHVHGYLHRKEGDLSNAGYWYQRAGTTTPEDQSLDEEWMRLVEQMLC